MSEKIWYEDPGAFLTYSNYLYVLPTQEMTTEEKLNALVRFFLYLGVALALIRSDYRYIFFGIIVAILSIPLYQNEKNQMEKAEKFLEEKNLDVVNNKVCARSTIDNPFMNPTVADYTYYPGRPAACDIDNPKVQTMVQKNFYTRLFRDSDDLYDKEGSARQFYTVPGGTIPNDQGAFADWCYGHGATCRQGAGDECYASQYFTRTLGGSSTQLSLLQH
jgi:hypothetical protein